MKSLHDLKKEESRKELEHFKKYREDSQTEEYIEGAIKIRVIRQLYESVKLLSYKTPKEALDILRSINISELVAVAISDYGDFSDTIFGAVVRFREELNPFFDKDDKDRDDKYKDVKEIRIIYKEIIFAIIDKLKNVSPELVSAMAAKLISCITFINEDDNDKEILIGLENYLDENALLEYATTSYSGYENIRISAGLGKLCKYNSEKTRAFIGEVAEKGLNEYIRTHFERGLFRVLNYRKTSDSLNDMQSFENLNFFQESLIKSVENFVRENYSIDDADDTVQRWKSKNGIKFLENISVLESLKLKNEEYPKLLSEFYGIAEFARYPQEVLVEQAENHGKDIPYGVIVFPETDHNDSFDEDYNILRKIHEQTEGKTLNRIFEVGTRMDIGRMFVKLRAKYDEKIRFMILGGHGMAGVIEFNETKSSGHIHQGHVSESTSLNALKDMFIENPSIVLFSCSTGKEAGIAQTISRELGADVSAPTIPSHPKSVAITYEGDKPKFDVAYTSTYGGVYDENLIDAKYVKGLKEGKPPIEIDSSLI